MIKVATNNFSFNTNEDILIPYTSDTKNELFLYGININTGATLSNNVANFGTYNILGTYTCYLGDGVNDKSNTFIVNIVAFNNLSTSNIKVFDVDKTYNLFNLTAKQGDTTGARGIAFKLIKNSVPFPIAGLKLQVGGVKPDGTKILNSVTIIDEVNSIIQINLTTQMLAVAGVLKLELIISKGNTKLSSYPFEVNIQPSALNFSEVISSNEFTELNEALKKVDGYNEELTNAVATGKEEVYKKLEDEFSTIKTEGTDTINNLNSMKGNLETEINELQKGVNSLDGGGINLLKGSYNYNPQYWSKNNGLAKIDYSSNLNGWAIQEQVTDWSYFGSYVEYEIGETYTMYCYAKCEGDPSNILLHCSPCLDKISVHSFELSNEWKFYSFTYTVSKLWDKNEPSNIARWECNGIKDSKKVLVSCIGIVKGIVATPPNINPVDYIDSSYGNDNLLMNSGQMRNMSHWKLNKGNTAVATMGLDNNWHNYYHGIKCSYFSKTDSDWCFIENTSLKELGYKFEVGKVYMLDMVVWVSNLKRKFNICIEDEGGSNNVFMAQHLTGEDFETCFDDVNYRRITFSFEAKNIGNENIVKIFLIDTDVTISIPFISLYKGYCKQGWQPSSLDLKELKTIQYQDNLDRKDEISKLTSKQESDIVWTNNNVAELQNLLKGSENVQFGNITRCILTSGLKMYFGYVENNHPDNKWLGVKFPSDGFKDNNYTILSTPVNSGYDATVSIPTGSISPFKDGSGFSISIGDNIQGLFFMAISRP